MAKDGSRCASMSFLYVAISPSRGPGHRARTLIRQAQAISTLPVHRLALLETLILQSPQYPSFEREAIHPIMGKVSVTLTRLLGGLLDAEHVDLSSLVGLTLCLSMSICIS